MIIDVKNIQCYKYTGGYKIRVVSIDGQFWFYAKDIVDIIVKNEPSDDIEYINIIEQVMIPNDTIKYILIDYSNKSGMSESDNELVPFIHAYFLENFIDELEKFNDINDIAGEDMDLKRYIQNNILSKSSNNYNSTIYFYDYTNTEFYNLTSDIPHNDNILRYILCSDEDGEKEIFISAYDLFNRLPYNMQYVYEEIVSDIDANDKIVVDFKENPILFSREDDEYKEENAVFLNDLGVSEMILRSKAKNKFKMIKSMYKEVYPNIVELGTSIDNLYKDKDQENDSNDKDKYDESKKDINLLENISCDNIGTKCIMYFTRLNYNDIVFIIWENLFEQRVSLKYIKQNGTIYFLKDSIQYAFNLDNDIIFSMKRYLSTCLQGTSYISENNLIKFVVESNDRYKYLKMFMIQRALEIIKNPDDFSIKDI